VAHEKSKLMKPLWDVPVKLLRFVVKLPDDRPERLVCEVTGQLLNFELLFTEFKVQHTRFPPLTITVPCSLLYTPYTSEPKKITPGNQPGSSS